MPFDNLVVVYGGELAKDVAEQLAAKKPSAISLEAKILRADDRPKKVLPELSATTLVCFVLQTIENASPTEDGGVCVRFLKRKTHPESLLSFSYAVIGLGDSNLLLDRQTTGAADCNQVAQEVDTRLEQLGATRCHDLGLADERTGLTEVEPWIVGFWEAVLEQSNK